MRKRSQLEPDAPYGHPGAAGGVLANKPLKCAAVPCRSCPYRRDTPTGVWHPTEYEKLRGFADGQGEGIPHIGIFLCHQTNAVGEETVCRGWLTVEQDSVAVRLALMKGDVTPEQVYAEVPVALYGSGEEAAAAGLSGVDAPSPEADRLMDRLVKKGAGRIVP